LKFAVTYAHDQVHRHSKIGCFISITPFDGFKTSDLLTATWPASN